MISEPEYDFLRELKNLRIRIPLLQAIKDLPIYVKIVSDACIRKPGRKPKDPITIHVMGKLLELMTGLSTLTKYNDLGSPIVTVYIDEMPIPNTLIDLEATINVMNKEDFTTLGLHRLRQTPRVLELVDKSCAKS